MAEGQSPSMVPVSIVAVGTLMLVDPDDGEMVAA